MTTVKTTGGKDPKAEHRLKVWGQLVLFEDQESKNVWGREVWLGAQTPVYTLQIGCVISVPREGGLQLRFCVAGEAGAWSWVDDEKSSALLVR